MPTTGAPTGTSLKHALSSPTLDRVDDDEKTQQAGQKSPLRNSSEWEEPHPGQRFSIFVGSNTARDAGQQHSYGTQGDGMAAKGYAPFNSCGREVEPRRFARPRVRIAPKHSKTSTFTSDNTSNITPIFHRPAPKTTSIKFAPEALADSPLFLKETEIGLGLMSDDTSEAVSSSELSSPRLSLTDVSNHLNSNSDQQSGFGSKGYTRPESFPRIAADEDPYGWEAELDRKLGTDEDYFSKKFQYRRAGGVKRSLLHRVFSLGQKDAAPRSI